MDNSKLKLVADFISKSKTKKLFYTLFDEEIKNRLRAMFFNVDLNIISVSGTHDNLINIIKEITPSGNPNNDYKLEEFKFIDSKLSENELPVVWHLYVFESKQPNFNAEVVSNQM